MSTAESKTPNHPFDPPAEVLIIDNDAAHAETVAESLDVVGFHCRVADSGKAGARMIEETPFDVVITDLVMNDIDGLGILERSKADRPDAEVILMTGHGTVPSAVEAMQQRGVQLPAEAAGHGPASGHRGEGGREPPG